MQKWHATGGFKALTTWLKAETGWISCDKARRNEIQPGTPPIDESYKLNEYIYIL